jgi:hypothetical protein
VAKPTFTLGVDVDDPSASDAPTPAGTSTVTVVDSVKLFHALSKGQVKVVGFMFAGVPSVAIDQEDAELLAGPCVILYVGGSAYKICA